LVNTNLAEPGLIPRISVQTTDNGIIAYYKEPLENARYFENFISVNFFGKCFYHPYKASVEMKVHTLQLKSKALTKSTGLFISSLLNQRLGGAFSYGSQLSSSKLKNGELYISMPIVKKHGEPEIAFEFIDKFIRIINDERIKALKTYLSAIGLSDCVLTPEEQKSLSDLGTVDWGTFKIEDVLVWQKNIAELNPLHLDNLSVSNEKKYPFYGQATINNGIIEYRHLKDEALNNKQGRPTILIHSNNQNTVYLDTPFYLKDGHGATSVLQSEYLNKFTAQFLIASIKKVILQKYTYNSKATKIELKNTEIRIPIKSDGEPDYEYMTKVVLALQKIVIKNVVNYVSFSHPDGALI